MHILVFYVWLGWKLHLNSLDLMDNNIYIYNSSQDFTIGKKFPQINKKPELDSCNR